MTTASMDQLEQLWTLLDRVRGRGPSDLASAVAVAQEHAITLGWREVSFLARKFSSSSIPVVPDYVPDFLAACFRDRVFSKALDPRAGPGALLMALIANGLVQSARGIERDRQLLEVAKYVDRSGVVDWVHGDPHDYLRDCHDEYDLVVSCGPFGMGPSRYDLQVGDTRVQIRDDRGFLLILEAALLLSNTGVGVFIVPDSFFLQKHPGRVYSSLPKLGLYVNSVIALPRGGAPWSTLPVNLVFVSRQSTNQLFIGQVEQNESMLALAANLRTRAAGRVPELGTLIEPQRFISWRHFVLDREIRDLALRSGVQPIVLNTVVDAINLGNRSEDGGFEAVPNAVYLPLLGNSPAVTDLQDLRVKPQNAAQIVLNPNTADRDFVAGFFNGPIGTRVRQMMSFGGIIPKTTKSNLLEATIYLPEIEQQQRVSQVHRSIQELSLTLRSYDQQLWIRPADASRVRRELDRLGSRDELEWWIETLPFPLASILWRYRADMEISKRIEHLLWFFEATAQFTFAIMLSAMYSNQQLVEERGAYWFSGEEHHQPDWRRASFGLWVVVGERLAKTTRQFLSNDREGCLDLFRVADTLLINALSSKDLFAVLKTVKGQRNDWKGHGGIASQSELRRRLDVLEVELTRVRKVLRDAFDSIELIMPGRSEYIGGIYDYEVKRIMGSRSIFQQTQVQTSEPMEKGNTYLLGKGKLQPLRLLPLFRMMPSPKTEETACYFYNRMDKNGVRWVSYHFESDAEVTTPDPDFQLLIGQFEALASQPSGRGGV